MDDPVGYLVTLLLTCMESARKSETVLLLELENFLAEAQLLELENFHLQKPNELVTRYVSLE